MEKKQTIAVVCLLRDRGHATAILRFARWIHDEIPSRVICHMSPEFESAATHLGFEFAAIDGLSAARHDEVMRELSGRSVFYNAFSNFQDLRDRYWSPLFASVASVLPRIAADVRRQKPDILLSDMHMFEAVYASLARHCGARHICVAITATPLFPVRRYVQAFGWSDQPEAWQSLVEMAGRVFGDLLAVWRRLRHPNRRRQSYESEAQLREALANLSVSEATPSSTLVSAGLGAIESFAGLPSRQYRADLVARLAPIEALTHADIPDATREWLVANQPSRVVYVSFGSMVVPSARIARAIGEGLLGSGASVLWAQPTACRRWQPSAEASAQVHFVDFAPQPEILGSGLVTAFVTHGGAGSVQEAMDAGVPMICVPYMFDQPYVASVVERLGVGVVLPRSTISRARMRRAATRLLAEDEWKSRAVALSERIATLRHDPAQTAWLDQFRSRRD